ncbi:aminotransferase class V-fold PLP-dependent enzyme [Vibrio rumoiensis]|uniref:Aminotransferase n=1 Tax=Vibrio rumoiensis 1S-45 TaxID=1188252 RepID=A0A1E5E477_9VIBR|nr:aminotransferase class V-fold PLP-dependent enzyme [Vibrio rumoiensis]OEF27534.1 aminotransferase [Vibrio rumoiensis 1S-45]
MSDSNSGLKGINRRKFIQGSASFAVAAASLGSGVFSTNVAASDWKQNNKHDDKKTSKLWQKVKKEFVLDKKSVYLNTGTTGSMPKHVLEQLEDNNKIVAQYPWDMDGKFGSWPYVSEMVEDIAAGFGANTDEIILSRNTTDGMCSILNGLHFESGDVILTTHHEHVAATSPLNVVKQRFGVEVVEVQLPVYTGTENVTEDDYIEAFRDALNANSNVRLITFSHITYKTGTKLPAKRLCDLAKQYGIPTLIDGAHTIGMLDLDLHDMDCDFYAGAGHKWQCGPGATGILYVRDNASRLNDYWSDRTNPLWLINSSLSHADYLGTQVQMQYIGNDNYPAKQALADSCKMWDEIGRDNIEERVFELSRLCKALLSKALPHAYQFAPNDDDLLSGITTFNPFELTDEERLVEFRDRLRNEYGFIIRTTDFKLYKEDTVDSHALRISTHIYNDEDDIRGLVYAIENLYKDMV